MSKSAPFVVHINAARTGKPYPGALPRHRIVLSCVDKLGYPDCDGAAVYGPERCTCDTLEPGDHERCIAEAWDDHLKRGGDMCHDCAFRVGSPEQEDLAAIAANPEPFRCHQGMPVDARSGQPVDGAYVPVLVRVTDGKGNLSFTAPDYPVCAGWKNARAALLRREGQAG